MSIQIDIAIHSRKWKRAIPEITEYTDKTIKKVLKQILPKQDNMEVSIVLADDPFLHELNKNYRGKDKPTNVLSFPQTEAKDLKKKQFLSLGDIVISFDTIKKEALDQNKDLKSHYTHMLVHGCLHLLHYDHETEKEAIAMENIEIKILEKFGIKNPYETE